MPNLDTAWVPKLPVPELSQTMEAYLEAVEIAVGDEEQKARTRSLVESFVRPEGAIGVKLQDLLLERQAKEENWAYQWWLDDMYLTNDIALPVNSNPGMVFPPRGGGGNQEDAAGAGQHFVRDVAAFVNAVLDCKELIDRQLMPQDRAPSREKGQPLCMAQYQRLFTSYRVPGLERDHLKSMPTSDEAEHIIVAYNGQFWRLEVRHKGQRLSTEEMALHLEAIIESEGQKVTSNSAQYQYPPLGLLTTANRRLWAQWRHQLLQDLINARSLQSIESSCMIICIDRPFPGAAGDESDASDTHRALQMIHGGGSNWNSANRWFDKTVQFIFSPDGASGTCYEHSPAEGVVLVQVIEKALEEWASSATSVQHGRRRSSSSSGNNIGLAESIGKAEKFPAPRKLAWKIDDDIHRALEIATSDIDRLVADLDFQVFRFTLYGKDRIKTFNVSPDVFIQLLLQLTYFKIHGKLVSTYESASTRRYRLGRVDCIRSATPQALAWVMAMNDPESSDEDKTQKFHSAAQKQTDVMVRNILGQGIDVHLLGLRQLAYETGCSDGLALFKDPSYRAINHFALSTSQVPTSSPDSFMGYGPVVPDGYGCSYNPQTESVVFCVSSFRSCETTDTRQFVDQLKDSLVRVSQLLQN